MNDDGLLRGRTNSGEWVQYESKADSQYAMHEFVGGCWFVFEGVRFSKRVTTEYTSGREKTTGKEVIQEFGSRSCVDALSKEYFLEGFSKFSRGRAGCLGIFMRSHFTSKFQTLENSPGTAGAIYFTPP